MPSQPPKVFISYSHDSPAHEQRVLALAERLRQDAVEAQIDRYVNGTPAEGWPRWMENQLEWADFVLLVCTETYYRRFRGHEQPEKGRGVDWEGTLVTNEMYDDRSLTKKFVPTLFSSNEAKFIPRTLRGHTHYVLDTEENYSELLGFLAGRAGVLPSPLGPMREVFHVQVEPLRFESSKEQGRSMGKLHGVPELPPHYLAREADLAGLKQKLLAGGASMGITGQSSAMGVQGMGGIGKSVLAAALARDREVLHAFPDGIYWLTLGQKPNLLDLQNQLLRQLTASTQTLTTEQETEDALRETLEGRSALVVVDDAWTIDAADAFAVTAPPARLLITTRNQEVLVGLGAEEHRVDALSPSDALKMLAEWVGEKNPDKLPAEAAEVAKECGYLPLALAMIGAMVRLRPTAWKDALRRLKSADLEAIKRAFPGYPYPDLLRAIEVSVEGLDSADRERYLDLAVFPEDQPIPEEALRVLWNLDEVDTRDCMTRLMARSLATWATAGTSIILHDLQRDLIHKRREKELAGLHLRLVKAWDALPKLGSYAWRRVAYHLAQAGRKDDLHRLLLNFNYLEGKLAATDPNALIADYDYFAGEVDLRLIQASIRLSAHIVARDPRQLAGQLIGRLLGNKTPSIQVLLKLAAGGKPWPWLRPLTPSLTAPGGPLIRTLEGHTAEVVAVAVTPDGRRAVSASWDQTLRLWDLRTGQTSRTLEGHTSRITAVAVTPDGRRALSASEDKTLRLWDLETGKTLRTLEGHTDWVNAVAVTPDGLRAVSASGSQYTLRVWDLGTGQTIRTLKGHTHLVTAVAVTPDGRRALSASWDKTLRLWDLRTGQTSRTLEGHTDWVNAVAVTPDGLRAVSASEDKTLRLWDLESGQTIRTLEGHTDEVVAVAVTPDGRRAVSASEDCTLRLWDLESGQTIRTLKGHTRSVSAVAVTPDGRRAVSASEDKTLRLWDLESDQTIPTLEGQTIRTLEGDTAGVLAVAVTPDGRRAVSGSYDRTLRLWDLESGKTIRTLEGHTDEVNAVAVTPDGRRAVSASIDQTLRLWDLESGKIIATFIGDDGMRRCAIAPGVRTITAGDASGRVHFLRLVEADETKPAPGDAKIPLLLRQQQSIDKPKEGRRWRFWKRP